MRLRSRQSSSNNSGSDAELKQYVYTIANKSAVGGAMTNIQGSILESATTPSKGMILVVSDANFTNLNHSMNLSVSAEFISKIQAKLRRIHRKKMDYDLVFVDENTRDKFHKQQQEQQHDSQSALLEQNFNDEECDEFKSFNHSKVKILEEVNPEEYGYVCVSGVKPKFRQNHYSSDKQTHEAKSIIKILSDTKLTKYVKEITLMFESEKTPNQSINQCKKQQDEKLISVDLLSSKIKEELIKIGKEDITISEYIAMAVYCEKRISDLYLNQKKEIEPQRIEKDTNNKDKKNNAVNREMTLCFEARTAK